VPLTPLLLALGAGIAAGTLDRTILAWVIAGAALGNLTSFALGRALRASKRGLPRLPAKAVVCVQRLFERHGAAAIVLSRYLGPPATIAPFLAGWSGLPWTLFLWANLIASVTWPAAMAGVGYAATVGWRWMATR
jgi:membrane-associated protein